MTFKLAAPGQKEILVIRPDGRIEQLCEHGIGHTIGHRDLAKYDDPSIWVHGCDGCCATWSRARTSAAPARPLRIQSSHSTAGPRR